MIVLPALAFPIGDKWPLSCTFTTDDGSDPFASGTPFGEFYPGLSPMIDLRLGSGITIITNPTPAAGTGIALFQILGSVTSGLIPQEKIANRFPVRLVMGLLDPAGQKVSYVLQPIIPLDPRSTQ